MTHSIRLRFAALFMVLVSLMVCAVIVMVPAAHSIEQYKSDRIAQLAANQPIPEPGFMIKASGDRLALWREGADKPYRVLDAELWLLSEADRQAVEEGVTVATEEELRRLLEDLGAEE